MFTCRFSTDSMSTKGRIREESETYFWYQENEIGRGATGHVYKCQHKVNC